MLYSKSWGKPVKTPEELMDLKNIARWLEGRPGRYRYLNGSNCLLAQYYKDHGYEDVMVRTDYVCLYERYSLYEGSIVMIPVEIDAVLRGSWSFFGRSFKGALKRARRLLTKEEQAYAL